MKKIIFTFIFLFFITPFCEAKDIKVNVVSLSNINKYTNTQSLRAKVVEDTKLENDITLQKNAVLDSKMLEIVPPKWWRRTGYVIIQPVVYIYGNYVIPIKDQELRAKITYHKKIMNGKKAFVIKNGDKLVYEFFFEDALKR